MALIIGECHDQIEKNDISQIDLTNTGWRCILKVE